jgi:hypothetical protein
MIIAAGKAVRTKVKEMTKHDVTNCILEGRIENSGVDFNKEF